MVAFLQFGRYSAERIIGHGATAFVYRGRDSLLRRDVAIKTLRDDLLEDSALTARFVAGAKALARINHPNVVRVLDVGDAEGRPFFAMELVAGLPLDLWLGSAARLPLRDALFVLRPLALAIDTLHASGLVHGNIKPANVMIDSGGRVVLMDLGVGWPAEGTAAPGEAATASVRAYLAPEQVAGAASGPATDIYALGVLAYQMLAGRLPLASSDADLLQTTDQPTDTEAAALLRRRAPGLPVEAIDAVAAALANDPARRPATALQLVAALESAASLAEADIRPSPPVRAAPDDQTLEHLLAFPSAATDGAAEDLLPPPLPPERRIEAGGMVNSERLAAVVAVALSVGVLALIIVFLRQGSGGAPRANLAGSQTQTAGGVIFDATPSAAIREGAAITAASPIAGAASGGANGSFGVRSFVVRDTNVWTAGAGPLQACVTYDGAAPSVSVRVRISPAADPASPLVQSAPASLSAGSGQNCLPLPSPGVIPSGDYVALLYDAGWQQRGSYAFNVAAAPAAAASVPAATAPASAASAVAPPTAVATAAIAATASASSAVSPPSLDGQAGNPVSGPVPRITAVTPQSAAAAGADFSFTISAVNDGASGALASITVSSADVTQMTARVCSCTIAATAQALPPGSAVAVLAGGYMRGGASAAWLAELDASSWPAGASCTILVTARMPASGTATFLMRTTIEDGSKRVVSSPVTAANADQQGFPAIAWTVPTGQ